jgi:hypothetical protein
MTATPYPEEIMKTRRQRNSMGMASAVVAFFALAGILGCGGGKGGASTPVLAKAASVQVTYYYLPG